MFHFSDPLEQFWNTQPVPQLPTGNAAKTTDVVEEGPIDPVKTPADVKQEPGALPSGFVWSLIDVKNEEQVRVLFSWGNVYLSELMGGVV